MERLCASCVNRDEDWFDRKGEIVKMPFCAANKPPFPAATRCAAYEPEETTSDAD